MLERNSFIAEAVAEAYTFLHNNYVYGDNVMYVVLISKL
jgi:hypothetical protein